MVQSQGTIPPRLSETQQFVLAALATTENGKRGYRSLKSQTAVEMGNGEVRQDFLDRSYYCPTDSFRDTFPRTLDRLSERGLVTRWNKWGRSKREREERYEWVTDRTDIRSVTLTDDGLDAGVELLRRHADGRYSLSFRTL